MNECINKEKCKCPYKECKNYGVCCKCIEHHKNPEKLPVFCMRFKTILNQIK